MIQVALVRRLIVGGLIAAVVVSGLAVFRASQHQELTAYFTQAKGLHVGDEVRVLDVKVGQVTSIEPLTDNVRVRMQIDGQKIPADARATVVSPNMVTVRHVALSPVYSRGPVMADDATIPMSRTAVPVEWDEMKEQLTRLAAALGPRGANKTGAVGRLLQTSAANLDGRGPDIRRTLVNLSRALTTLSDNRGHLFASVRNLQVFTDALADSDATVREFNEQLASVSGVLAGDRKILVQALRSLGTTLRSVKAFVRDHRGGLTRGVDGLNQATKTFSEHRQALADTLQTAPTALSNYYGIYDPNVPAMTGYFTMAQFQSPAVFICSTLYSLGGTPQQCESAIAPVAKYLDALGAPSPVGVNPIQRNGRSNSEPAPGTSGDYDKPQNRSSLDGLAGLVTGGRS